MRACGYSSAPVCPAVITRKPLLVPAATAATGHALPFVPTVQGDDTSIWWAGRGTDATERRILLVGSRCGRWKRIIGAHGSHLKWKAKRSSTRRRQSNETRSETFPKLLGAACHGERMWRKEDRERGWEKRECVGFFWEEYPGT